MWRNLLCGFFLAILASCDSEDMNLPAAVNLSLVAEPTQALDGNLSVNRLEIQLNKFEIRGERSAGGNILLDRNLSQQEGFYNIMQNSSSIEFDIPQGTYNALNLSIYFVKDEAEAEEITEDLNEWLEDEADEDEDDGDGDGDDEDEDEDGEGDRKAIGDERLGEIVEEYLDKVTPALLFTADISISNKSYLLVMAMNEFTTYNIPVINNNGGNSVSLSRSSETNMEMVFNPEYWFNGTSLQALRNAEIAEIKGQKVIFLHKQVNPNLYTLILNRIEESTQIRLK